MDFEPKRADQIRPMSASLFAEDREAQSSPPIDQVDGSIEKEH
jgi:hypothetical protein